MKAIVDVGVELQLWDVPDGTDLTGAVEAVVAVVPDEKVAKLRLVYPDAVEVI